MEMNSRYFLETLKFAAFLCNSIIIIISLMFNLIVVFPAIHKFDIYFYINSVLAIFVCFNIIGNLLACESVDTSIRTINQLPAADSLEYPNWHYCRKCATLVPARSWHCNYCKICIIKRDHHCAFTSCCIGHRNYRYFLMFLFYGAIGCFYAVIYESLYIWWLNYETYGNFRTLLKLIMPFLLFWPLNWDSAFLFTYIVNFYLALIACGFFCSNLTFTLKGMTSYEFQKGIYTYDLGSWKRNLEQVLGRSMHLIWLSPFVKSKLPHDGIEWDNTTEEIQLHVL